MNHQFNTHSGNICFAYKCKTEAVDGLLFCRPHWLSLPEDARIRIQIFWKAVLHNAHSTNTATGRLATDELGKVLFEARIYLARKTREKLVLLIGECEAALARDKAEKAKFN